MKRESDDQREELPGEPVPTPKLLWANAAARKETRESPFAAGWENCETEYCRVDRLKALAPPEGTEAERKWRLRWLRKQAE